MTLGLSKVTRQAAQRRRNPVEDGVLVSCMAKPCPSDPTPHPTPLPQGERELLLWCNALCLLHPIVLPHGERGSLLRLEARPGLLTHRGWNPRTLPQARDAGLVSAEAWEFGQIPSLPPLAVATTMRR